MSVAVPPRTAGPSLPHPAQPPDPNGLRRDGVLAVADALEDVRAGRPVVLVDDVRRAAEGTLVVGTDFVTAETIAFLATHGRGLICLCMPAERCAELGLEPMTHTNDSVFKTDFRISIEARTGVSTGISAADRARTIRVATDPATRRHDIVSPGHVFPLRAQPGGVLRRPGRTEAAVDLARLAGLTPAAVVCELLNADGSAARGADVADWCERHGFRHVAISELLAYRRRHEVLIERIARTRLPTAYGEFDAIAYRETLTDRQHLALVRGSLADPDGVLVSVHTECSTGDVFRSLRCDCAAELERALRRIATEEHGVLLYLGRGEAGAAFGTAGEPCSRAGATDGDEGAMSHLPYQLLSELGLSEIRLLNDSAQLRENAGHCGLTAAAATLVASPVAAAR